MCYLEKNNKLEGKKDLKNTYFSILSPIYFPHGQQKKHETYYQQKYIAFNIVLCDTKKRENRVGEHKMP